LGLTHLNAMHVLYAWRLRQAGSPEVNFDRLEAIDDLVRKVKVESLEGNHVPNGCQDYSDGDIYHD
jgi:hypothetical protein